MTMSELDALRGERDALQGRVDALEARLTPLVKAVAAPAEPAPIRVIL